MEKYEVIKIITLSGETTAITFGRSESLTDAVTAMNNSFVETLCKITEKYGESGLCFSCSSTSLSISDPYDSYTIEAHWYIADVVEAYN